MHNLYRHILALPVSAIIALPVPATSQTIFINIGEEKGLSSLQITDLFQDKYGFVWVGTPNGLNRFDGYGCTQYFSLPGDTTSLGSSYISPHGFAEDASGNLWVATYRGGLSYFNRETERFTRYRMQKDRPKSLSMDKLFAIEPDRKGGLWIATAGRGINYFDPRTREFRVWDADEKRPGLLMGSTMTGSLKLDNKGWLWVGTNKGVCRFDPAVETFEYFPFLPGRGRSLSDWFVTTIMEDSRGRIWLGTAHGLNRWDADKGIFVKYFFTRTPPEKEPGYDYILDMLEDGDGRFWLGTNGGLLRFDPVTGTHERFVNMPDDPFSIYKGPVNTILKDRNGNIWFGTSNGISILNKAGVKLNHEHFLPLQTSLKEITRTEGVNAVLEEKGALWLATQTGFYQYRNGEAVQKVSSGNFSALFYDREKGEVYAGTTGDGFYVFDAEKRTPIRHVAKTGIGGRSDPFTVKGHRINGFAKDCQGFIWIAADGSLNRYDPAAGRLQKFHNTEKKLQNPSANTNQHLLTDSKGNLWIASMGGLSMLSKAELSKPFNDAGLRFEQFIHQSGKGDCISSDVVYCLLEDAGGRIWAGTDAGLNRYDPHTGAWQWFFKSDGLPGNDIVSLVEDQNGDIWAASAQEGLAKFDSKSGRFFRFSKKDGLYTDRFRPNAGLCAAAGFVVLGGRTGLAGFHPDSLRKNESEPFPFYFTDFKILNKTVPVGEGDNQLPEPVYQTGFIGVDYDHKVLSFQFNALNFISPEKQVYRYRLVPFQQDWQYNGNKREATFTNLDPGEYHLQAETSENGYEWTGKSLMLHIRPPWYRTWWAYLFYALATGSILYTIRRFELRRQSAKAENRRLQELHAIKTRLYTNITHEFRTPLTVILGEASRLEKQMGKKQEDGLAAIRRQGRQLLNLVNQMLDLAKAEGGSLRLNMVQGNIVLFLKYVFESFHSLADSRHIKLSFDAAPDEFRMDYDPDKLQKIVSNLLSNALKFTPRGGRVAMNLEIRNWKLEIGKLPSNPNSLISNFQFRFSVSDTGPGIPPEKLGFIFDRFYQADDSAEGTGIGLTLTKELVHLLGGDIRVESPAAGAQAGTTFTVTLPVTRKAERQSPLSNDFFAENREICSEPEIAAPVSPLPIPDFGRNRPRLLLVEDNPDVMRYISSLLSPGYRVYRARNGREGVEAAFRIVPDLVISDVMMPEMDGFGLCRVLKTDERSSHIPVILLTAKADQNSKTEGLKYGADAYLAKPFHPEELLVRLEKLVELRRRLQERYAGSHKISKLAVSEPHNPEDRFLQKVVRIVEARMSDEHFDMPQLCKVLNMSRSNLFRKLKALTGKSATDFIRSRRLEKARELLETTDFNVTEVCFKVGFSSPNYFSRVFQEAFGVTPSEARKR